jgi:uncharacterized protein YbjT (DUF2867 family)
MAKYIITGSIGHISKPIVEALVKAGHQVVVITSKPQNQAQIEALGATAAVGSVQDATFVNATFSDADVVYTMIPPIWNTTDWRASQNEIARIYTQAIRQSSIKYVVNLSSIGAHLGNGAGPIDGLADFEQLLNQLDGVKVSHLRPSFFYYNLFSQIGLLKQVGIMGANYATGNEKVALVHTDDIAAVAVQQLLALDFDHQSVTYISSDERTGAEIAQVLSSAVGKPAPWVAFSDEQAKEGMLQAGLLETHANGYVQLGQAMRNGTLDEDYLKSQPVKGKISLEEFAKEFVRAYEA